MPSAPQHTPLIIQPTTSKPQKKQNPRKLMRQDPKETQPSGPTTNVADEALNEKEKAVKISWAEKIVQGWIECKIESYDAESLSEEDTSKHGRKITYIDADKGLTLIDKTTEDQGRINNEEMFDTYVLNDEEIFAESVDVAEQTKEIVADKDLIDDITLAKALMELAEEKAQQIKDENFAWDNVQAMIDADYELAARLQEKKQGELTIKEKSRLFVELMDNRKKHFAKLRVEEKRRKPLTKA
nr:hypothetical protein [Tanacetum cinerariifolium]